MLTLPDRTWVPIAAPSVGVGASPAGFGMKAGGVSLDTLRQRIRVLGGDVKSNSATSGTNTNTLFEGELLDTPLRMQWRMVKPECPNPATDTFYPKRPDRPMYCYDSKRDRDIEWIGFGDNQPVLGCTTWADPRIKLIRGAAIYNPRTELWEEGDWPPPPYEWLRGLKPVGARYDNLLGDWLSETGANLGRAYGGDSNMEWGGSYDPTSDRVYDMFYEGGWGANIRVLDLTTKSWRRKQLFGAAGELRHVDMHRCQTAIVPGEALWWYSRRLKGVVRWDLNLTERTERIVATMPPEAYQPVDTSTNGTYQDACAYDPVNRVVLAIPWYTFNGDFPGMLLVKVDPPYETEWIPMRAPTVDDFKGVTRLPWGNRLVYLPWAHAFYILGGHNPGVTGTRPARDPDPALSTKELTRWHWLFRLGGIPPTPPAPPAPPDPEPGTVPPTPPPTPTSPPEPGTVPPPPPPPPVPRVDIQVTKPQGVDVYVNGQKM